MSLSHPFLLSLIPYNPFLSLSLSLRASPYRCLKVKIELHDDYPKEAAQIFLSSETLSNKLLKKLHKGVSKIIKEESKEAQPHVFKVVKSLHDIIHHNLLTYAWPEVSAIQKWFAKDATVE